MRWYVAVTRTQLCCEQIAVTTHKAVPTKVGTFRVVDDLRHGLFLALGHGLFLRSSVSANAEMWDRHYPAIVLGEQFDRKCITLICGPSKDGRDGLVKQTKGTTEV